MNRKPITTNEAVKIIRKEHLPKSLEKRFKDNGLEIYLDEVYSRTAELFNDNADASKELYTHLGQILPSIAYYEALLKHTGNKEEALRKFDEWAYDDIIGMMPTIKRIMALGVYRIMPWMCSKMLDKLFGEKAGFQSRPVPDAPLFSRDMTVCPYFETCKKYGYPEVTQLFCKSDDITYGDLHPKLIWKRTQTLGMGGECCDFRLWLNKNK